MHPLRIVGSLVAHSASSCCSQAPTPVVPQSIFFSPQEVSSSVPLLQIFFGIGINYYGTSNELATCNNDLVQFRTWWRNRAVQGGSNRQEFILTDLPVPSNTFRENNITFAPPTRSSWFQVAKTILQLVQAQDAAGGQSEIVCYASCHGFYQLTTDLTNDLHGRAECLCMTDGFVWDYDAYDALIDPLPSSSVRFLGFNDECHSGTFWNLYLSVNGLSGNCNQENNNNAIRGLCWSISGSLDNETAGAGATSRDLSVSTASFLRIVQQNETTPFWQLLKPILTDIRRGKFNQTPLFCVSHAYLASVPLFVAS